MDVSGATNVSLFTPIVQYLFAGLCGVLLLIVIWLVRNLLQALRDSTVAITKNTEIIERLLSSKENSDSLTQDIRDLLLSRPCMKAT